MIPLLALLLAAPGQPAPTPVITAVPKADERTAQARFTACVKLSDDSPAKAIAEATAWWRDDGGVPAGQCLGIAYAAAEAWTSATAAFTDAAELAVEEKDGRAANLWVSAGNAALAGGDYQRAKTALSSALALPVMTDQMRGEAFLDRARAEVAAKELPAARSDMDEALKLVAADPMVWLLSATLARMMDDVPRAKTDIAQAGQRAPGEPPILFEAGNIAAAGGDMGEARANWARAKAADPQGDVGKAAAKALADSGGDMPAPKPAAKRGR